MVIYEIGTGYTSIPARIGAATEIIVEKLTISMQKSNNKVTLFDIADANRASNGLPIHEVRIPKVLISSDAKLGLQHKLKRVIYSIALARQLKKMIAREKEQFIIHFHNQYNMYFFLKMANKEIRKKVRIAYTVHSYIWTNEWAEIKENIRKRYFQEVYCVKRADYIFVLNDKTKENFINHLDIDETKVYKIGNGVDTNTYFPLEKHIIDNMKAKLEIAQKKIIFQVGSVCERKNQLEAIKELASYMKANREVVYLYAGGIIEQDYQDEIVKYTEESGISEQIIYLGEIVPGAELNKYYNIADLVFFPSKIESFGLVIIEAIAAGSTTLSSSQPLFKLEEGCEVYHNQEELENLLHKYLGGDKIIGQGRKEVIDKYNWDKVTNDYCEKWK